MEVATEATVLGDFDDASFEQDGVTTRFFRRDGRFLVNTAGPDGKLADFEVAYTFGVDPLQQYLIPFPGGRLQSLTIAWDTNAKRWFSLYPDERIPPDDALHWTGRYQNWNSMCAECHSTHLVKGYDAASDSFATTWAELDVGCQACHGPGAAHVRWAESERDAKTYTGDHGLSVKLARGFPQAQLDACAPCHSRRNRLLDPPPVGAPFLDGHLPELLHASYYEADGQNIDEVYEWGSFVQSKMHRSGVACSDCHDPHSLELVLEGNAVCLQCHTRAAPLERFPTLQAKDYDTPEHHHHEPGTPGAQCVNCHMRSRTYMVVDPRRDHGFRVPRPDLTEKLGVPNACGDCHAERGAAWASTTIAEWAGESALARPSFAPALSVARAGAPGAGTALIALARDADQPVIARATALELLAGAGPSAQAVLTELARDPEPLLRLAAARGLESTPPKTRVAALAPLLTDPLRSVRIEAARSLASMSASELPAERRPDLDAALAEFVRVQELSADFPWAHANLGRLHADQGRPAEAERAYRRALELDPAFLPASFNLGNLLNQEKKNEESERVFRAALERAQENGELHYSLGLLLAEMGRLPEAADSLARAAELLPERARVHYNAGLAAQHLGRSEQAERELSRARELDPLDPSVAEALAIHFLQQGDLERAQHQAEALVELTGGAPAARALLERTRQR